LISLPSAGDRTTTEQQEREVGIRQQPTTQQVSFVMQSISSSVRGFLSYGVEYKVVNKIFISLIYGTDVMS
jgi:hypothetical protein